MQIRDGFADVHCLCCGLRVSVQTPIDTRKRGHRVGGFFLQLTRRGRRHSGCKRQVDRTSAIVPGTNPRLSWLVDCVGTGQ